LPLPLVAEAGASWQQLDQQLGLMLEDYLRMFLPLLLNS
jgi:hypothetical protein